MKQPISIPTPQGKLGVLFVGLGAVATTTIAGILLTRRGLGKPVGSLTQMGMIRSGSGANALPRPIRDLVPLARLEDIEFGAWDIFPDDAYEAALHAKVLEREHVDAVRDELRGIRPMPGVFHPEYVKRLSGTHVKPERSKTELVELVREDIRRFKSTHACDRLVAVWCASTEVYLRASEVHRSVRSFEAALAANAPAISNAQIYAWACIKEGVPLANGAPNLCVDFPAVWELARENRVPLAGKDFKTGQTLLKTALAPTLKARMLGLRGWFSTNILGNRDGEVLDDPESFRAKEVSKLGVLEGTLHPELYPDLYGGIVHEVQINYYPPRGDAKEGWDNVDLFGWLGYPMQLKLDFLCRDSILAAPLVLDLALFMDLAKRVGFEGTQEWLSFYFKSPMHPPERKPEHDLFAQLMKLKNTLRWMCGDEPISQFGNEYYD